MLRALIVGFLVLFSLNLKAQVSLPADNEADRFVNDGMKALQAGQYTQALNAFYGAVNRPVHAATSAGYYLLGQTYYRMGFTDSAMRCWYYLSDAFPQSLYIPETKYQTALVLIGDEDPYQRTQGVMQMAELAYTAVDPGLAADAFKQFQEVIYTENQPEKIGEYYTLVPQPYQVAVIEALVFRLMSLGQFESAKASYDRHLEFGGAQSPYAEQLLTQQGPVKVVRQNETRLAVFLPLFLDDPADAFSQEIPRQSKLGLEFYEGIETAVRMYQPFARKKIYLRVLDNRRDSLVTQQQLRTLDELRPDFILGDVYNGPSTVISRWAEANQVPQLVPISPSNDLISGKHQVFLAHPTSETHGTRMAEYAFDSLGLRKVSVWSDRKQGTAALANAFEAAFIARGGQVIRANVDSVYSRAMSQVGTQIRNQKRDGVQGTYIPIMNNEETCGLILSLLQGEGLHIPVMGGPHWYTRYKVIDRTLKERVELVFSTSFFKETDDLRYRNFYENYYANYETAPTDYALYGYDLGMYLLQSLDSYDPQINGWITDYLHQAPAVAGIHTSFLYGGDQSNQFVNLCKFSANGVVPVNRAQPSNPMLEVRVDAPRLKPQGSGNVGPSVPGRGN